MDNESFEDYLLSKGDEIDNAAYALAAALLRTDPAQKAEAILPWDMAIIGPLVDEAKALLENAGRLCCYPYFEDDLCCSQTGVCRKKGCPFKTKEDCK